MENKKFFIIAGAAKSGTTSLFEYLCQHPEIYGCPIKEPCYFSSGPPEHVKSDEEYLKLFKGCLKEKWCCEASSFYLFDPEAPYKMNKLLPKAKIVIILRNPADRAYSLWCQNRYYMKCENLSFSQAMEAEPRRMVSIPFNNTWPQYPGAYQYVNSSMYCNQVKRYYEAFSKKNVKVIIFEEFIKEPAQHCSNIFDFLDIDKNFQPKFKLHNISSRSRFRIIQKFLSTPPSILTKTYHLLPVPLKLPIYKAARTLYYLNITSQPGKKLEPGLNKKLLNIFMEDIHNLERLLGRDLRVWTATPTS